MKLLITAIFATIAAIQVQASELQRRFLLTSAEKNQLPIESVCVLTSYIATSTTKGYVKFVET